jgi:hypothetical protein
LAPSSESWAYSFCAAERKNYELNKLENTQDQTTTKLVSTAPELARPDARVEHVDLQFWNRPDLQSSSSARECLVLTMNAKHSPTFTAEVPGYAELQREIHDALLAQNPEWILPNGESPTCAFYEARFAQLLMQLPDRAVLRLSQRNAAISVQIPLCLAA